jgi:phosphohistidine phosphatase
MMITKKITFVRHAKSLHNDYVKLDMERHLAERGYNDALVAAQWCKSNNQTPDFFVSSPAIRAYSTCLIFANVYGYPKNELLIKEEIYEASANRLLYVIAGLPPEKENVIIFGHNPGFTDIVNVLCNTTIFNLPTAGIAIVDLNVGSWNMISESKGTLLKLYTRD